MMNSIDKKFLFDKINAAADQLEAGNSLFTFNTKRKKARMIRMALERAERELESKKHPSSDLYDYTIVDLLNYKASQGELSLLEALNYNRFRERAVTKTLNYFTQPPPPSAITNLIQLIKSKFNIKLGSSGGDLDFKDKPGTDPVEIQSVTDKVIMLKIRNQGAGCNEDIAKAINEEKIPGLIAELPFYDNRCNATGIQIRIDVDKCKEIIKRLSSLKEMKFLHNQQVNKSMDKFDFSFPATTQNVTQVEDSIINRIKDEISKTEWKIGDGGDLILLDNGESKKVPAHIATMWKIIQETKANTIDADNYTDIALSTIQMIGKNAARPNNWIKDFSSKLVGRNRDPETQNFYNKFKDGGEYAVAAFAKNRILPM